MRLVIAIGGNALLQRGEVLSAENQARNIERAADALAKAADGHEVVLVHGNGPQVGLLALEAEAFKEAPAFPLDVLGAESQGMIGYVIGQVLNNAMPGRRVATLLTRTLVDPKDAAFGKPTKPIGPVYSESDAQDLTRDRSWVITREGGDFRRVVPSPAPIDILELPIIEELVESGVLIICGGGGGIPVVRDTDNRLSGVEAVVDKDLTAALLAQRLKADRLLILTDVDGIYQNWGQTDAQKLRRITASALSAMSFAKGSMGPKVEAACSFVITTGNPAMVGSLADADEILKGIKGTWVTA